MSSAPTPTASPSATVTTIITSSQVPGETATPTTSSPTANPGTSGAQSPTPTISTPQTQSLSGNLTSPSSSGGISSGNGTSPGTGISSGNGTSFGAGISSGNGISNGALAGAIVGSIAGTAVLTFLLACLFYRRRRNSTVARAPENGCDFITKSGAISSTKAVAAEKQSSFSLAAITPHPADDKTVHNRILTLIDHATLHVDNFYASTAPPVQLSPDAIGLLGKYESPFLPEPLVAILQGQRGNGRQAIAHALVYTLLAGIQPGGELLPPVLAVQPAAQDVHDQALFAWRMTTAYLYNRSADSNADAAQISARTQAAHSLAANFTVAFSPYALSGFSESERTTHLSNLAIATAELGVWLFSQPCTFEFMWQHGQSEITVAPEVRKTRDEHGIRLATPQILIEAF